MPPRNTNGRRKWVRRNRRQRRLRRFSRSCRENFAEHLEVFLRARLQRKVRFCVLPSIPRKFLRHGSMVVQEQGSVSHAIAIPGRKSKSAFRCAYDLGG